jgi:ribose transport system permease protein
VTLATWEIFAGLTLVITKGYPIRPLGEQFRIFGQGELFGIPVPVLVFLAAGILLIWLLTQTRFGRNIFAVGGNRDAAILVGIRVRSVEFLVFGLAGMFAAVAGMLYASRMDAGQPSIGEGWLMGAITAAILGGTSLRGGQGSIVGTMLGALLLTVLANGTVLLNVSGFWQRVIVGIVVLIAVLVDLFRRHRE